MNITLENLTKRFPARGRKAQGETTAVRDLSFQVPDGMLVGLLGPSGCGKSTTLNMICGLERPTSGKIFFGEEDVTNLAPELRGVGMVFQNYALYPHLTVMQNILFPLENLKGKDRPSRQEMRRRALETAQLVLAVFDSSQELTKEDRELMDSLKDVPSIAVVNKTDLPTVMAVEEIQSRFEKTVFLSAANGEGLEDLEQALSEILDTKDFHPEEGVLFTQRQRGDAQRALESLEEGEQALLSGMTWDAVTVCVEDALLALSALTGEQVSEEIVDRVFEEFCVGK